MCWNTPRDMDRVFSKPEGFPFTYGLCTDDLPHKRKAMGRHVILGPTRINANLMRLAPTGSRKKTCPGGVLVVAVGPQRYFSSFSPVGRAASGLLRFSKCFYLAVTLFHTNGM